MKTSISPIFFATILCFSGATITGIQSAEVTWTGDLTANWSLDDNWDAAGGFTDFDSVLFNNLTNWFDTNNDLVGQTVTGITVTDPFGDISIGGEAFTLGSGGITMSDNWDLAISSNLTLGAAQEWNVAAGRVLNVDGSISGSAALTLTGGGTVELNTTTPWNTGWSGAINITSGRLISPIGVANTTAPYLGTGTITLQGATAGSAILNFRGQDNSASPNIFENSVAVAAGSFGQLVETLRAAGGGGIITLTGGLTMGESSTLHHSIGSATNVRTIRFNGASSIADGAVIENDANTRTVLGGGATETQAGASLTKRGQGTLTIAGDSSFDLTGAFYAQGGALSFYFGNASPPAGFRSGNAYLQGGDLWLSISGTGSANFGRTFHFEQSGTLAIGRSTNGETLPTGANANGPYTINGLVLSPGVSATVFNSSGPHNASNMNEYHPVITVDSQFEFAGASTLRVVNGATSPSGAATSYTLNLASAWTRNGQATLGIELLTPNETSPNVSVYLETTATGIATNGVIGFASIGDNFAQLNAGEITALTTYTALTSGSLTANANYEATGDVTVDAGQTINALKVNNSTVSELDLNNSTLTVQSGGVLFSGTEDYTITNGQLGDSGTEVIIHQQSVAADLIIDASLGDGATGSLTKTGAGTLLLSTPQTFGGQTAINRGRLELIGGGSLAGDVLVHQEATLAGVGTIGGDIELRGTLAPGNSPGTLTLNSTDLTIIGSDAVIEMEINSTTAGDFDRVVAIDTFSLDGSLTITLSGTYAVNDSWSLFEFSSKAGNFDSVALAGSYIGSLTRSGDLWTGSDIGGLDWQFSEASGMLNVIPEPSTAGLLGLGLLILVGRRRWLGAGSK